MADIERIKRDIAQLASRRRAVRFEEIERLVRQLGLLDFKVEHRRTNETHLFRVAHVKRGTCRFGVCSHNSGRKHVKAAYVTVFLDAMAELGLYGD
jgi:hypothetical protein